MTAFEKDIVSLVRAALIGEKPVLSAGVDYAQIYAFGKRQQILYMLNTGLSLVDGFEESEAAPQFLTAACREMAVCLTQQQAIGQIRAAFSEKGIDFLPLKGTLMRELYPIPEMRTMADADILIKKEQVGAIAEAMQSLGYTESPGDEHEIIWKKANTLYVELHRYLVPPFDADMFAFFENHGTWAHAVPVGGNEYRMTPEDELIFDFLHFVKHFRGYGAGIRHIADIYLFRKSHPDLDETYLLERFAAVGCAEFYRNVCVLIDCWFGDAQTSDVTDRITSLLFAGGIYGDTKMGEAFEQAKYRKQYRFAGAARLWHLVFPPFSVQKKRYPVLGKAPILLPFTWIFHGFQVLFRRPETFGSVSRAVKGTAQGDEQDRFDMMETIGIRITKGTFKK